MSKHIVVIGAGPAGLMAAEVLAGAGLLVSVYDRMPSVGRKLLMAGRGGLNLTHSEALPVFIARYGAAANWVGKAVEAFTPEDLRAWCEGLGQETFVGSSGRVFPRAMKASPLLRAWLKKLDALHVQFHLRRRWTGWDEAGRLLFEAPDQTVACVAADAVLLAMGGASWAHLGSDGKWAEVLAENKVPLAPFKPSNCGFVVAWSEPFRTRFAGKPIKPVLFSFGEVTRQGEALLTERGIEGGAIYALSSKLREAIEKEGTATLYMDLRPGLSEAEIVARLSSPRGSQSLSTYLRKALGLPPEIIGLLREVSLGRPDALNEPDKIAALIKRCPLVLVATTGMERAISTAGGIKQEAVDDAFMLRERAGVFVAGEMLDWEAPTGGYLLQGCMSTGVAAAKGVLRYLG